MPGWCSQEKGMPEMGGCGWWGEEGVEEAVEEEEEEEKELVRREEEEERVVVVDLGVKIGELLSREIFKTL
ncbi:hypothetical protein QJS10_CPB13g00916 [Acorus calamus]|uniref:Uncharacterized protein n=1 Tax=Acorus calamus TaxID=4465 RepID=A0AAV9DHQ9_ACOCL|nr:hypothetical protein QJS10_CPB13g00916 [Acorus calamus]